MSTAKIEDTVENWENGTLGNDERFARPVEPHIANAIDDSLGLQMISIRLNKDLIDTFKVLAQYHGVGYQPLMRDALRRFAEAEMKQIVVSNMEPRKQAAEEAALPEPPARKCA